MSLNTLWFVLYVVIIGGYVILDGFDLGVGMLGPIVAKDDREKRILLNSIGPVWDGNEVWLVLAGGALFAAFPLVVRLAVQWLLPGDDAGAAGPDPAHRRHRVPIEALSPRWRSTWDWFFTGSSLGITVLLGVALGNVILGVPIDRQGNMYIDLWHLLDPYAIAVGVTAIVMLCCTAASSSP